MAIVAASTHPAEGQQALARVLELLREEQVALESRDATALVALASAKQRALHELRMAVGIMPGQTKAVTARDQALIAAVREARATNLSNGIHVSTQMAYSQSRLAGLMQAASGAAGGAPESGGLYRADGFTGGRTLSGAMFGRA